MARVTYVQPDGSEQTFTNYEGLAVMHLAVANLVDGIDALCGGMRQCATCHVYVDPDWAERVGPPGPEEAEMLDALADAIDVRPTSRLSCQIPITEDLDGLRVFIPTDQPGI